MRRQKLWIALIAAALLGGCAQTVQAPVASAPRSRAVAARGVDCTTDDYVIATVSTCGKGGLRIFSAAGE